VRKIAYSRKPLAEDRRQRWDHKSKALTASIGIAGAEALAELAFESLLDEADKALYIAKRTGRNRIHVHSPTEK